MRLTPNQQKALNIEKHVCVTAGAGSGKTTVLVDRYLKILRSEKAKPPEIVAITFTDKAAAEMKERVVEKLNAEENIVDREKILEQMNTAPISTIHAFCSHILREFPFQADVPANFSILQGIDQKLLLQQILRETLKEIATNEGDEHRAELTRLLQRYSRRQDLEELFSSMVNQRDIIDRLIKEVYGSQYPEQLPGVWEKNIRAASMSEGDVIEFIRCLKAALQLAKGKNVPSIIPLAQKLETLPEKNPDSPEVMDILKKIADPITTQSGGIAKNDFLGRGVKTSNIESEIDFLVSAAEKIKTTPSVDANGETDDDFLLSTTRDLLTLYTRILNNYQTAKLSQGTLDFNDLQLKTRDLLRDNTEIQQGLVERHTYYMVDEYQDTNKLQHELVMLLTNKLKDANLFIVGDPKQSIYGFRGADVQVFEKTKQKIKDEGGTDIPLKENFRSLQDTVRFVNHLFDRLMGDGSETEFEVPFESLIKARPIDANGAIDIVLGKKNDEAANEYTLIAQQIKNIRQNGETVWVRSENGAELERPIEYGDIAILIRSRTHLPDIEHALLQAGIPYLTTGGIGFYQRQEIYDIWNYLNFLDIPTEHHASLAGVLRGPAFGISDTRLYEISQQDPTSFWNKAQNYQAGSENLERAIDTLKRHIQIAHRLPVNQLIVTIVNETGMIGTLKTGKQGQQRWANYQKLLELARNFDGDESKQTLTDFIEFLDILITEEPREGQAPIEPSKGAIQIMTIHAAKGLQFPVVILPCLDRGAEITREPFIDETLGIGFSPLNPGNNYKKTEPRIVTYMKDRAIQKETAEKKRLFYVGATRAQNRLILSGSLSDTGKPRNILEWLYKHLGIGKEDDLLSLPFKLKIFPDRGQQSEDIVVGDKASDETTPVDFPEHPLTVLSPTEISASFSVTELANYARCPLRYQLENVLRIPTDDHGETDLDETERDAAIRYTLGRIRRQSDTDNLDPIINQAAENYPEVTSKLTTELHTSANNFIDSELGDTALSASETRTNQQIHADIEGHIINGRFDRLFKDETGHWQIINYETADAQDSDVYVPEMELYSLLLHQCHPEQPTVKMNLFFTEQDQYIQKDFSVAELQEAKEAWQRKISELQRGIYDKNLDHCCSCPYAAPDGQCIITEGEEEE